mgnify:CR=1 FL=1
MYQQNQYNFMILDTSIIIMSSIKKLDVNDVPILSKYDNQEKINISEYNKNGYTILLEECNNKYYIHVILNDEHNLSDIIKQIEELLKEILKRLEDLEKKSIKFNPDPQTLIELKEMIKKAGYIFP